MRAATLLLLALILAPVVAMADADGDGIEDALDNCPYAANIDQADAGGPLFAAPDGIGDVCQCGDVAGDGRPDLLDVVLYRRALEKLAPGLPAFEKCDVAPPAGECDASDLARLRDAIAGIAPGIEPLCTPAVPPSSVCGNGVVEPPEVCDGADLDGESCVSLGYLSGSLACTGACGFDTSACTPFGQVGDACTTSGQCTGGLPCVDGVCCTSACGATCARCDLPGLEGTCAYLAAGADPDAECAGVSCSGWYAGWSASQCLAAADASAALVGCNGAGACQSAGQLCPSQPGGSVASSCDPTCQVPAGGTCVGTTAGSCSNVNPGTQTCGVGACTRTVNQCQNGAPLTCVPGTPTAETCNDVDDDCNGTSDDGAFADALEPNASCAAPRLIAGVGSDQSSALSTATVFSSGDVDVYRIDATETDSSCGCCAFCTDEDYQFRVSLAVPAGAGSYQLCASLGTCGVPGGNCLTVPAGTSQMISWNLDGACGAGTDAYVFYVSVRGASAPGYECRPYTLSYTFDAGLCF
ncbi:MAG: hypothetical protein FJ108_03635 [Deltaproteobacteria bacterium]|nr:hypothetical protein [Deltaproteobacteria bacterium]